MQMPAILQDFLADADALRKKRQVVEQMYTERSQYEQTWKQLSRYINPTRGRFDGEDQTQEGRRRDYYLLDPYPMEASGKCAAGLHSGLTSPSRPWFALSLQDDELAQYHTVKLWLDDCKDILMSIYAKSNIYNMLLQLEAELSQFGTAASLLVEDYNTAVWARPYTCGEFAGDVDARGRVCQFARKFKLTAWQIVAEFGYDVCSDSVKHAYDSNNLRTYFEVTMLIEKNLDYKPDKMALGNFPWRSYYWERGAADKFLKVSGFNEVPFLMPRWTMVANGIYGTGPGHNALGNCMQLQKLELLNMRLLETRADPPMIVPASVAKIDRLPGGKTVAPDSSVNAIRPLFQTEGSREDVVQTINVKQQQIGAAFFNDLFVMLSAQDNPQMTAREVAERHEEKLLMLSPVLEQMHNEVLAPLTRRTFEICMRNGLLPPVPQELQGQGQDSIKVEFISLLAQAQKMVAAPSIEKTLAMAGNLAGLTPDIMDNFNMDAAIRAHANMNGTPESIMRSEDEVAQMRKQRAQEQARQQQMQEAAAMAKPAKDSVDAARLMSQIPVSNGSGNALNALIGGGGV